MTQINSLDFAKHCESAALLFWFCVGVFEFGFKKKSPKFVRIMFWLPGKFLRLMLIVMTFGILAACANSDPLAVASGPVFQLNPGHWQPAPQDLAAPPKVTNQ